MKMTTIDFYVITVTAAYCLFSLCSRLLLHSEKKSSIHVYNTYIWWCFFDELDYYVMEDYGKHNNMFYPWNIAKDIVPSEFFSQY